MQDHALPIWFGGGEEQEPERVGYLANWISIEIRNLQSRDWSLSGPFANPPTIAPVLERYTRMPDLLLLYSFTVALITALCTYLEDLETTY